MTTAGKRVCKLDGCRRVHYAAGYCNPHWRRWRRNGDPGPAEIVPVRRRGLCAFKDCDRDHSAKGYCASHYAQFRRGLPLVPLNDRVNPRGRDEHGRKRCSTCKQWLAPEEFNAEQKNPDGLKHCCRRCAHDRFIRRRYGIGAAQYDTLLAAQKGGCAICGGVNESGRMLAVDHDHTCCSGEVACGNCVRGLLCSNCNMAIGLLREDAARFEAAVTYLKRGARHD